MSFDDVETIAKENFPLEIVLKARILRTKVDEDCDSYMIHAKEYDKINNFAYRMIDYDIEQEKETWLWVFKYPDIIIYNNKEKIESTVTELAIKIAEKPICDDMLLFFNVDENGFVVVYNTETKRFSTLLNHNEYENLIRQEMGKNE